MDLMDCRLDRAAEQKRVLIVDDDPTFRMALGWRLRNDGFEVMEAADAVSAASKAMSRKPDLLILDYIMPAGTGKDVYQRLQNNWLAAMPPVIFLSSMDTDTVMEGLPVSKLIDFLPKPVDLRRLMDTIRRYLDPSSVDA